MVSKKKINGWAAVALVFLVCAVVYGLLSSYPRELAVYSDELRYLDVARSLLQGRGLRVRNMPSDYQKILYAVHPAGAAAADHSRADHGHRLAERCVYGKRGLSGLCAGACDAAEPAPHGVSGGGHGGAAHHVGSGYLYERNGVSAAFTVAGVLFPAGNAGCAAGRVGWCAAAGASATCCI